MPGSLVDLESIVVNETAKGITFTACLASSSFIDWYHYKFSSLNKWVFSSVQQTCVFLDIFFLCPPPPTWLFQNMPTYCKPLPLYSPPYFRVMGSSPQKKRVITWEHTQRLSPSSVQNIQPITLLPSIRAGKESFLASEINLVPLLASLDTSTHQVF